MRAPGGSREGDLDERRGAPGRIRAATAAYTCPEVSDREQALCILVERHLLEACQVVLVILVGGFGSLLLGELWR
eukprot:5329730-Prymnesium_polylepis.1